MAYCPAERKTEGLVLNQSVAVNIMSSSYCKNRSVFINYRKDEAVANKWIESLRIKTPSYRTDTVSPVRRQPAEGRPFQVAGAEPGYPDPERADARH